MSRPLPHTGSFLMTEDCNLACTYCVTGETKILTDKFTSVEIKDVQIGDTILGFDEFSKPHLHRKVYPVKVLETFKRQDNVIQITLENGMTLKITKGHPILNARGNSKYAWKEAGKYKIGDLIRIVPEVNFTQVDTKDYNYMVGYTIAMMMSDGSYKHYIDGNNYDAYRFRLAVKDDEIIERMRKYLEVLGFSYTERDFEISKKENLFKPALFSNKRESYNNLLSLIESHFRKNKTYEYFCGFLAGVYDAEGHIDRNNNTIRITNSYLELLEEFKEGLGLLNIDFTIEKNKTFVNKQTYNIRILANQEYDHLKFVLSVRPSVKRKGLENFHFRSLLTASKITSIVELGEETVYNLETESHTYLANNFAVHNCFENHKKNRMSPEVIHRALEYFYENAKSQDKKEVSITVFGGEPLLEPDLIRILFDKGLELQKEYSIEFKAGIITNGTIMNDKVKQLLLDFKDKINMGCQISVDGNEEAHDLCRVTKQGYGSFHMIAKNIETFKDIFKDNAGMLHVHGVVSKKTLPSLFESYKFFKEQWGISRTWFMPVHEEEWEASDVALYKEQLDKIADYIINVVKDTNSIQEVKNYSPLNKCFEQRTTVNPPCSAGKTYVTITANGDIYPCHHFYFNDPQETMKIGDVWSGVEEEKRKPFIQITNKDMTCEDKCSIFNCYRCLGANWVANGDMHKQIRGYYCEMAHIENEVILRIRTQLQDLNLMEKPKSYSIEDSIDLLAQGLKVLILEMQDIKLQQAEILEKLKGV